MILDINEVKPKKIFIRESKAVLLNEWGWNPTYYSMDDKIELGEDPYSRLEKEKQNGKKRNFPIKRNGVEYWVSRSSSVSLYLFCKNNNGEWCLLANQRGENVPRHGKWNVVCGFIDYGETLEHAAARECLEECGIKINSRILRNCGTNSKREVINTRFFGILPGITDNYPPSIDNCEGFGTDRQEVINAKWIPLSKLSEFNFVNGQIDSANDLAENMLPQSEFSNSSKIYKDFFYSLEKLRTTGMLDSEKYNKIMAIINGKL